MAISKVAKQKKPSIKYVYAGKRRDAKGRVYGLFIRQNKKREEAWYRGIKGVSIGYTYLGYASKMPVRPERTDDERQDNPSWEALDTIVDSERRKARLGAQVQRLSKPALAAAVAAIKPLLKGLSPWHLEALVRHLVFLAMKERK